MVTLAEWVILHFHPRIVHFHYIYHSSHMFMRKFWIHIEMFYQVYNLIFAWFSLVWACLLFSVLLGLINGHVQRETITPRLLSF